MSQKAKAETAHKTVYKLKQTTKESLGKGFSE